MSVDSTATEAATGAETPAEPRPDHHVLARDPFLSVFVDADGALTVHGSASGVNISLRVPARLADAFVRAVSTPYSGGIGR